jgi:hypothetical protein
MIHIDDVRTSGRPRNGERVQILSENGTARADIVLTEYEDADETTAEITLSTGVLNRTHHWQLIAVSTTTGSITLRLVART